MWAVGSQFAKISAQNHKKSINHVITEKRAVNGYGHPLDGVLLIVRLTRKAIALQVQPIQRRQVPDRLGKLACEQ